LRKQELPPIPSKQAKKFIDGLDKSAKQRIKKGIDGIPEGDILPYKSRKGHFRLRIGDYRIIFTWINQEQILITSIDNRGGAYK
jgi:mRNA interferase RelE/StbE